MARKSSRQVEHLPAGWEWRYKGEETYFPEQYVRVPDPQPGKPNHTKRVLKTVTSDERHAVFVGEGPDYGKALSVRQVQNRQRERRAELGEPKPAAIARQGKTKTINYRTETHGKIQSVVFRDFESLKQFVAQNEKLMKANKYGWIKLRYDSHDVEGNNSDANEGSGYAALTPWSNSPASLYGMVHTGSVEGAGGREINPWIIAEDRLSEYTYSSPEARFYLQLYER